MSDIARHRPTVSLSLLGHLSTVFGRGWSGQRGCPSPLGARHPRCGLFLTHLHATVDRCDKGLKSWSPLLLVVGRPASCHSPAWDSFPGLLSSWTMGRGWKPSPLTSEFALGWVIQDACVVLLNEIRGGCLASGLLCYVSVSSWEKLCCG